tara:strand:+ start:1917 stop:2141 length:225 start_codon:yes stop_codon:yes gene_type:complete
MKNWFIVSGITFVVFFGEAIIHYNYGIRESRNETLKLNNLTFPKGKSLIKMSAIVVVASVISGSLVTYVENKLS